MKNPPNNPTADLAEPQSERELAADKLRFNSRLLFGTQNEIVIEHQGDDYRLRITSNGKLILTK
ncbi:MAG: hemin uptake protein HemP [Methylobacter sp.]|nr:hemin uptake protein HemP [Methylococcales bacterium]MDD5113532.1 hemin uptake protein HemP [Methylobacter sp.]